MALGKGLGAILQEVGEAYEGQIEENHNLINESSTLEIEELAVDTITANPYQPRKYFDEASLQELSQSIIQHGLLQPIVVIEKEDGYILIAGERRLRAHRLAKLKTIKAIIADVDIDKIKLRELALIENIQREELNAIELANSYAELIEVHNITHEELSYIVNKSRSQITNTMRLLTLSEYVQANMLEGKVSQGHGKVLVGLDKSQQKIVVDTIIGQKLNVRETENLVKQYKNGDKKEAKKRKKDKSWMQGYDEKLKSSLDFKHSIKSNKLEIIFKDEEDIKRFIEIIKKA